jgi:hypothetical protein
MKSTLTLVKSNNDTTISNNNNNDTTISSCNAIKAKEMLDSIGLSTYLKTFLENKMIGLSLLELTDRDLDYMNIRILAHRNAILKATHELQKIQSETTKDNEQVECSLFQEMMLDCNQSKACIGSNPNTANTASWSRKVSTLRQECEESRADIRKRPSTTTDTISHEFDSEDQEHQVRINKIKII